MCLIIDCIATYYALKYYLRIMLFNDVMRTSYVLIMFIPILQLLPDPPNFVCSCSQHPTPTPLLFKPIGLVLGVGLALECS